MSSNKTLSDDQLEEDLVQHIYGGDVDEVKALLKKGANVHFDDTGDNALLVAIDSPEGTQLDLVELLLAERQFTPFEIQNAAYDAAKCDPANEELQTIIQRAGGDHQSMLMGNFVLLLENEDHDAAVKLLGEIDTSHPITSRCFSETCGRSQEAALYLLEKGVRLPKETWAACIRTAQAGHLEVLRRLITHPNATQVSAEQKALLAICENQPDDLEINLAIQDPTRGTAIWALDLAAKVGSKEIVKILLDYIPNKDNENKCIIKRASEVAKTASRPEISQLIETHLQ